MKERERKRRRRGRTKESFRKGKKGKIKINKKYTQNKVQRQERKKDR